jgi:acyl-CoA synthetase (AMP-forming)/AMP-acid ligase II
MNPLRSATMPGELTVAGILQRQAQSRGDHLLLVCDAERISYAEADRRSAELARGLIAHGGGKGTHVGLLYPNGPEFVVGMLAATRIGAVVIPFSTFVTPPELREQLVDSDVEILLSASSFRSHDYVDRLAQLVGAEFHSDQRLFATAVPQLRHVGISYGSDTMPRIRDIEGFYRLATTVGSPLLAAMQDDVDGCDPLTIVYTSGSANTPKGVVHTHTPPCSDISKTSTRSALLAGATLVTEEIPRPETTLRLLETERVTLFRGWPDQAEALARHAQEVGADLSALRPGSLEALLPPEQRAAPGARATLFGMTEAFGPHCGYPADTDMPATAWGSCGKPFSGMEVRIADPDSGEPVPAGIVGMIQIRGPHTLRGICDRSREDLFTADGFYPTGDLGHLDEDGFLFYHGRSDDMFKVSGATVYPSEVERALRAIDGVQNAYVTTVSGAAWQRVGAAVVCNRALTAEQLRGSARQLLSAFKVPTVWLLLVSDDDVPRGGTGKVDTHRLREILTEANQP